MKKLIFASFFMAVLLYAGLANADSQTGNLNVSASVNSVCSVGTSTLSFGTYDPSSGTDLDAQGIVSITCTLGTSYTVALDLGAQPNGSVRRMIHGTYYLNYEIYKDSGRLTIWNSSNTVSGTGTGSADSIPAYGRVPKQQPSIGSGSYSDTVLITVNY